MSTNRTRARVARSRRSVDATPTERLAIVLKLLDEHADRAPENPLISRRTPPEALKECCLLLESLYMDAHRMNDGKRSVYLMLYGALEAIGRQLEPLFDAARRVAGEAQS